NPSSRIAGPISAWLQYYRALFDLDERWRAIESVEDYKQIVALGAPPIEELGEPDVTTGLARLANEEMAELVRSYPDHFEGFAAALPLNDVDASIETLEHAMRDLGALGAQLFTPVTGQPLDDPRFDPVFDRIAALGGAVWLHPTRGDAAADYETESSSRFG